MKTLLISTCLLAALSGAVMAQTQLPLPRECAERHNVDPNKCIIQDGPPAEPWVRKFPLNKPPAPGATASPVANPPTSVPAAALVPPRAAAR